LKISDPTTGFRLPKTMLAAVDAFSAKHDVTRSQIFRRSIMEFLGRQDAAVTSEVNSRETQQPWPGGLFGNQH
jgi:metal-responsive CopG/Arc/MetJ family transcriptional regulator